MIAVLGSALIYYMYIQAEKQRLMACVQNSAALRGINGAEMAEQARAAAERMLQDGLLSTIDAYKAAATIWGCYRV